MSLEWRSRAEREWVEEKGRKINEGTKRDLFLHPRSMAVQAV